MAEVAVYIILIIAALYCLKGNAHDNAFDHERAMGFLSLACIITLGVIIL